MSLLETEEKTQKQGGHKRTEAEIGVMQPQTMKFSEPPERE